MTYNPLYPVCLNVRRQNFNVDRTLAPYWSPTMLQYFLCALALVPSLSCAYASPVCNNSSGGSEEEVHNPNVVLRNDGAYFRFSTLDGINIATSSSIDAPWTNVGSVSPQGSVIDLSGNKDLWALDCFFYNGLYYVYYAVSTIGMQDSDISPATSTTMETGSWTDHGSIDILANSNYNKIDPKPLLVLKHQARSTFSLAYTRMVSTRYQWQLHLRKSTVMPYV